jgi:hypothetical protein
MRSSCGDPLRLQLIRSTFWHLRSAWSLKSITRSLYHSCPKLWSFSASSKTIIYPTFCSYSGVFLLDFCDKYPQLNWISYESRLFLLQLQVPFLLVQLALLLLSPQLSWELLENQNPLDHWNHVQSNQELTPLSIFGVVP